MRSGYKATGGIVYETAFHARREDEAAFRMIPPTDTYTLSELEIVPASEASCGSARRSDGRRHGELRAITMRVGVVARAAGSSYVQQGSTKVVAAAFGPRPAGPGEGTGGIEGQLRCDVRYASCSQKGNRFPYVPGARERHESELLTHTLSAAVLTERFPRAVVDVRVLVVEDDGAASSVAINAAVLALANALVPMHDLVASSTVSLDNISGCFNVDPTLQESNASIASLSVAAHTASLSIAQMQAHGALTSSQTKEALQLALDACSLVSNLIKKTLVQHVESSAELLFADVSDFLKMEE